MDAGGQEGEPHLGWKNVGIAASLILVNGLLSMTLGLKLEANIIVSAIRCVVQLTIMGLILEPVFANDSWWTVMLISCKCTR
jgi:ABC-type iron transport system FetAB permease component